MALSKTITLDNGIITRYHRIVSINHIINHASIIEICSYTSSKKRTEEKDALKNNETLDVYLHTQYINTNYNDTMTTADAYEFIKSLEQFEGATDDE